MAISKVIYGGENLIDLTSDTITEQSLLQGVIAHNRRGELITGQLDTGSFLDGLIDKTITNVESNAVNIGEGAFKKCINLTSAIFPNAKTINRDAFYDCSKLVTVSIPSVTRIAAYAFTNCIQMQKIEIVKQCDIDTAFFGCSSLNQLILRSNTKCTLKSSSAFNGSPIGAKSGDIYVPRLLVEEYKQAPNWSVFSGQFRAIEDMPNT